MKQVLVYDSPTRIFHWLFTLLFIVAFLIGKTIDDESALFAYHMMAGLSLGFVILLRWIWGMVGSRYARWTSLELHPQRLVEYFKAMTSNEKKMWAGHNPASSWAALLMISLAAGLAITGYLMASGENKESLEEIHEWLANGLVIVVLLHIAGVVIHTIRTGDPIGLSMISGKKSGIDPKEAIASKHTGVGIASLVLIISFAVYLLANYNADSRILSLFGQELRLGESEEATQSTQVNYGESDQEPGQDDSEEHADGSDLDDESGHGHGGGDSD